jgi:methylmalonyl-CoA mutase
MQAASRSLRHANRPGTPIAQKGSVGLLGPAWHFAAMTDPETVLLATDFPPATREEWRKLVDAVLKGAPFERLVSTTYDGLAIEPLAARRSDAKPVAGRAGPTPWEVLARIDHPDPARANEIALRELNNGASGLALVFSGSPGDHGFGLDPSEQALTRALEGVRLDAGIALDIDLTPFARDLPQRIAELVKQSADPAATKVRFGYDPLTAVAITGKIPLPWSETAPLMARLIRTLADAGFKGPFAVGDGRVVHNAGGSEAQELAFALACAVAYLRALEASGMALESARDALYFRLSADADQFLTVAKFRAARKLWARIEAACGLSAKPVLIAAETAWRMMARRDPHVNILRATIAVFAAALGGADAITVLPFTAACGLPDRFARRIARNTQLILGEESHLAKVADPAAGSGAVEDLTDALCQMAWALFRDIEAAGGVAAALESGLIQGKVATVREKREAATARRREALTGVSIFPNLREVEATVDAPFPAAKTAAAPPSAVTPLVPIRLAQPFEALRDASDRLLAKRGARPKVFLATLGTQAEFGPRTTFAKNFFEAGGIEAVSGDSASRAPLPEAYKAAGAALACLCSTDKIYEKEANAAAAALKAAGARHLYLAGRPGEREAALQAAGVQSFIYEGCDALATLKSAYDILGIEIG